MTLVVPFDGSNLSKAALARAVQFDSILDEGTVAVSVIPNSAEYARERGWIGESEPFDTESIASKLREDVTEMSPDAAFHHIVVDRYAPLGTIATRLRQFAREHDASVVFVGSDNAGRIVSGFTVGQSVAGDRAYDTMIISHETLPEIERLEAELPAEELLS